jgi:hypothetical protein
LNLKVEVVVGCCWLLLKLSTSIDRTEHLF